MSTHLPHKPESPPPLDALERARAGDAAAVATVLAASMWIVHAQVRRWRGDPDDLTQVALVGDNVSGEFHGLMGAIRTFRPDGGASFWSYATGCVIKALCRARTHARRKVRRPKARVVALTEAMHPAAPENPELAAAASEALGVLAGLPERKRDALAARAADAYYSEIAAEHGISYASAYKLVNDAAEVVRRGRRRGQAA